MTSIFPWQDLRLGAEPAQDRTLRHRSEPVHR